MDSQVVSTPNNSELNASQIQTWSVLVHVLFLIGFVIPFGGVIGLLLVHLILGKQNARIRENSTAALNVELTSWAALAGVIAAILAFALILAAIGFFNPELLGYKSSPLLIGTAGFLMCAVTVGYIVYRVVAGVMNAIDVSNGRDPKYNYSIQFISK